MVKKTIFLLVMAFALAVALASASQLQNDSDLGIITSDNNVYSCWSSGCLAYINLAVNASSPYANDLWNISLNNTADIAGITYKIYWLNASSSVWINQSDSNTWINGNGSNYNLTTGTHQFMINITLPYALSAKWNISFTINWTNFTLNPYIDSINLTSPANGNITNVTQTPSFNFTLYSNNWTTQSCSLYMNINNTEGWIPYGVSSSTINNTPTVITANSSLSEGNYTWKIACDVSGSSGSRWIYINDTTVPVISGRSAAHTFSTATITWTTSEAASSRINYGTDYSLDRTPVTNGSFTTSHSVGLTDLLDDTTYYYNITSCDQSGNCVTNGTYPFHTDNYTDTTPDSSPSSSSATTPSTTKSNTWTSISSGIMAVWNVNDKTLGIKQINLSVSNTSSNAKLTLASYSTKPSAVSVQKSGKVYKYLKIDATNLANLSKAYILLQVDKSWVQNNSLTKQDFSLYKFDNISVEWKKLATTFLSEDSSYYYYNVELSSFSYFTIAGENSSVSQNATGIPDITDANPTSANSTEESSSESAGGEKNFLRTGIIVVMFIVGIIAIAAVGFIIYTQLLRKKAEQKTNKTEPKIKHL